MIVIGIVAEYSPFHNGHHYMIESARKNYPEAAIICVMSGHFLQRGEPALINKWARAEMAIQGGIDLVIELPLVFSVRSAYYFARSALVLLQKTGLVTHLAFGSESGDLRKLQTIARILANEPAEYRNLLKALLREGRSFATARSQALQGLFNSYDDNLSHLLSQPNDILALEYLRVIEELRLNLEPIAIQRQGSFHSQEISPFASATAIRQSLSQGADLADLREVLPLPSRQIMEREITRGAGPVFDRVLAPIMLYKLRTMSIGKLKEIYEVIEGLEYRIKDSALRCGTMDELRQSIKSKRYSMTKINRLLIYTLFDITARQIELFDETGPLYHHVLAFSNRGQHLLQKMKHLSALPVLNRGSRVKEAFAGRLGTSARNMISLDVMATDLFNLLLPKPDLCTGGLDFITSPLRIGS